MFLLFSGEGPTDLGVCRGSSLICRGDGYLYGPMAAIADQIVEERLKYSILAAGAYGGVTKATLKQRASILKSVRKGPLLPGRKRAKETAYFFQNARALASFAKELAADEETQVIAILFRDADGTASAGRGLWADKWKSMINGFEEEDFGLGVPMIPKPKSEAWLICGHQDNPHSNCADLEERSGNDDSPNSLKDELEQICGSKPNRELLCELVSSQTVNIARIDMPSFKAFRERLESLL